MKAPWLVQRAKFKGDKPGSIDNVLQFDYMGSAEFEFGALPKSLKRLTSNADSLEVYEFGYCTSGVTGEVLYILSIGEIHDDYLEYILQMASGDLRMKESPNLNHVVTGTGFRGDEIDQTSWCFCDVWWDIENDVMWAFGADEIKRVLDALKVTRDNKKKENCEGWY